MRSPALFAVALLATVALPFALPVGAAHAEDAKDAVVATVGGVEIHQSDLDMAEADLDPQFQKLSPEQRRVAALSTIIDIKMIAKKAEAEGLDKDADFQKRLAFLRERALHNAYFQTAVVDKITDADLKARYEKEIKAVPPQEEISARHILVKTEEEAKKIIADLDAGKDFAKLAAEHSTGPSGPQGGELGYFTKGSMVPEFEEAAFKLNKGEYTKTPVKTQFGWHVIQVEDKRMKQPPAFEQVADQIRQVVVRDRYFEELNKARAEAKVEVTDPALKKAYETANAPAEGGAAGDAGAAAGAKPETAN